VIFIGYLAKIKTKTNNRNEAVCSFAKLMGDFTVCMQNIPIFVDMLLLNMFKL